MTKDLILTYATDIDFSSLRRLIVSARRVCPSDRVDIVVIINALGEQFAELANQYDVQLFPSNSVWKEIRPYKQLKLFYRVLLGLARFMSKHALLFGSSGTCRYLYRKLSTPWQHPILQRHSMFEDLLEIRSAYRMVFLTDARDVVLQADPFACLDENKLHVFLQHKVVYGEDNLDTTWIDRVLDPAVSMRLRGKVASCCGTTIGGRQVVLKYLRLMTSAILERQFDVIDQAIHNQIVYLDLPHGDVVFHGNSEGPVLTLGGMMLEDVELTETDLRLEGRVVPVLHMYDRVDEINEFVCGLYP